MNETGIIRRRRHNYSQVSNVALEDNTLSLKAKGMYALIECYSSIPNFILYKSYLKKISIEGDRAFDSAWKELKDHGYLTQEKQKADNGRFIYIYELLDEPLF